MFQKVRSSMITLGVAFFLAGCGKSDAPRSDMPLKISEGIDKKGRPTKVSSATLEDPNVVKKR